MYDKSSHTMRFFQGSQNLVSAFACSGAYGAVAEVENCVHVFGTETGTHCGSLPPSLKSVTHLVFSSDGSTLVGVGTGLRQIAHGRGVGRRCRVAGRTAFLVQPRPIPLASVGFVCWGGPASLCIGRRRRRRCARYYFAAFLGKMFLKEKRNPYHLRLILLVVLSTTLYWREHLPVLGGLGRLD